MSNVRWARIGFALLAWVFVALTVLQVYLAGAAVQQLGGSNDFGTHQAMGYVIMIIALVQLVLSFAARLGWRMIGASALLLVLMLVQSSLVHLNSPSLAALHPVNGFLVAVLGLWVAWRGLSYIRAPLPVEPEKAVPAEATPPAPAAPVPHEPVEDNQI
jgi:hypothetical protein